MNLACPNCQKKLRVPEGAVGRRARCPACQTKFVVPHPDDQMFETISGWVVEDPDAEEKKNTADSLEL